MAAKSNQHFVPQFYFRSFSKDGKSICVLSRDTGKLIKTASIKGQASKKNFYGSIQIENALAEIEGEFSYVFNKIKSNKSLKEITQSEYQLIAENLSLQKARTLSARTKSKKIQDHMYRLSEELNINNNRDLSEEEKIKLRKEIKKANPNPENYQILEMSIAIEAARGLLDMYPLILKNKTNRPLVFGDSPVVYINPQLVKVKHQGVLGSRTPGLLVYFPVDSNTAIMLIDIDAYKVKGGLKESLVLKNLSDISSLNKLELHNSSKAVYFSDFKYSDYVKNLWRQEKNRFKNHNTGRVVSGSREDAGKGDGSTTELLHYFQPQLPYIPKLSFLKYDEIAEKDYIYNLR